MNINRFIAIARMREEELFDALYNFLSLHYDEVVTDLDKSFMFVQGQSSVCLVAHIDTVLPVPPTKFFRSRINKHLLMGDHGLGADDRAGVYAIMDIINKGLRPSVIFTTGEEIGAIGATVLTEMFPSCPVETSCMIELDREGKDDSVYYYCGNTDFQEYINTFGFKTEEGIFSDICILGPAWDIAAVNLSIGFMNQHTRKEKLNTHWLDMTIEKVIDIIRSEPHGYDYQEDGQLTFWHDCFKCTTGDCDNCDKIFTHLVTNGGNNEWLRKALL